MVDRLPRGPQNYKGLPGFTFHGARLPLQRSSNAKPGSARLSRNCDRRRASGQPVSTGLSRPACLGSSDPVARFAPGEEGVQVVERPESHGVPGPLGGAAHVRQQEDVVQLGEAGVDVGLVVVDVEAGSGELARAQSRDERVLVDDGAAPSMSRIAISVVAPESTSGVLGTTMPRSLAAARSQWSTPTEKLAVILTDSGRRAIAAASRRSVWQGRMASASPARSSSSAPV